MSARASHQPKGEFTVIVAGQQKAIRAEISDEEIVLRLKKQLDLGISPSQASKKLAQELNIPKRRIYQLSRGLADEV